MPGTTFRAYVKTLSPTVFHGPWGTRLMQGVIGLSFDLLAETFNQATKAWILLSNTHPHDALRFVGEERQLPRYAGRETDHGYRLRLVAAWETWAQAGSEQELLRQLTLSTGYQFELYDASDWNWDGNEADWSRFWVVVKGTALQPEVWGGHAWGQTGMRWGADVTFEEIQLIRTTIRQWKPAHVRCDHIIVVFDLEQWNADLPPDGTWGNANGRSNAAVYWRG